MIFDLPPPAIIQRAEPWELPRIVKPALADLARYGGDPALAHLLAPPIGWKTGGAAALALAYINQATSTTNASSYDFGDFNASSSGLMLVAFVSTGGTSRTVSSVSIGGTNGTIHVSNSSSNRKFALASRAVSAGNNNVTVTLSGTNGSGGSLGVGVWLLTNYASATPIDFKSNNQTSVNNTALDFAYDAGSFGVYGAFHSNNNATTWSSATPRFDADVGGGRITFADKFSASAITPHSETISWSGLVNVGAVGGSWK